MFGSRFDRSCLGRWQARLLNAACAAWVVVSMGCADKKASAPEDDGTGGAGGTGERGCEPLELSLGEFTEEGQPLSPLQDGDFLRLWNAPQGGHVVLVAAEVRGITDDVVGIEARLLDEATGELVRDDRRSIVMKPIEGQPGWMSPEVRLRSQVAHIPLCPDVERRTLQGKQFILQIEISELNSECERSKMEEVRVTPDCLQRDAAERAFCTCQCQPEYEPGSCAL